MSRIVCTPTLTLYPTDEFVGRCLDGGVLADILSECDAQQVDQVVTTITTEQNATFAATNEAVWLATSLFVLSELFRDAGTERFRQLSEGNYARLKAVPHWRALVEYLLENAKPPQSAERGAPTTADVSRLAMDMLRGTRFAQGPALTCAGVTQAKTIAGSSTALSIAQVEGNKVYVGVEFLAASGPLSMEMPRVDERRQLAAVSAVFSGVGRGVAQATRGVRPARIVSDIDAREFRQLYTTLDAQVSGDLDKIKTADEAQAVTAAMLDVYTNALVQLTEAPGAAYAGKTPAFMKALVAQYVQRGTGGEDVGGHITRAFNDLMRSAKAVYEKGTALRRSGAPRAELHDAEKRLIDIYKLGAALLTISEGFVDVDVNYVKSFGFTRTGDEWAVDFRRVPQVVPLRGNRVQVAEFPTIRKNPAPAFIAAACAAAPVVCLVVSAATVVALAVAAYLVLNKILHVIEGFIFQCMAYMDTRRAARASSRVKSVEEDIKRLETEKKAAQAQLADNDLSNDEQARAVIATTDAQLKIAREQRAQYAAEAAAAGAGAAQATKSAAEAYKRGEALPEWVGLPSLTPGQKTALKWGAIALGGIWVMKRLNIKL